MALELQKTGRNNRSLIITSIIAAFLQVALAPQLSILGGSINFMLALTATIAIGCDSRTMVYVGFFAGLFFDLTSLVPIGLMTLLLTLLGYVAASISRGIAPGFSMDALRIVCAGVLIVEVLYSVLLFFMGVQTSFFVSLGHGLSGALLTILVCAVFLFVSGAGSSSNTFGRGGVSSGGMRFKGLR